MIHNLLYYCYNVLQKHVYYEKHKNNELKRPTYYIFFESNLVETLCTINNSFVCIYIE